MRGRVENTLLFVHTTLTMRSEYEGQKTCIFRLGPSSFESGALTVMGGDIA